MTFHNPKIQWGIVKWTLISSLVIGGSTYFLGYNLFFYGLAFGVGLMLFNYMVLGMILDKALGAAVPDIARILSFASYHVRFWIVVIVMYLVIPKQGFQFGIGSFVGILLPKMMMGVALVKNANEEWWRNAKPPEKAPLEGKKRDDGIRFPGLDFDDRYKNDGFHDPDEN